MEMTCLGDELNQLSRRNFSQLIQLGSLLLELADGEKGKLDLTRPASAESGLPVLPSRGNLFEDVCLILEKYCPFDWKGKDLAMVIALWTACDTNKFLAEKLRDVSSLRRRQGDKISADMHAKAATLVANHATRITSGRDAQQIKGIGVKIGAKIDELLTTRKLEILEKEQEVDRVIKLFTEIWGVGIPTARAWFEKGWKSYEDLRKAEQNGDIALTKLQKYWMRHSEDYPQPMDRAEMTSIGNLVEQAAMLVDPNSETVVAGSFRRGKQSSKDVDVVIFVHERTHTICQDIAIALGKICELEVVEQGQNVFMGGVKSKLWRRLDVFVATTDEAPCALLAHTGPAGYNRMMRGIAKDKGWKLNEYHLTDENGAIIPTQTEADVQELLGLDVLEPRDRM